MWATAGPNHDLTPLASPAQDSKAISLRLPVDLLERIKTAANKQDVPYQSLIKIRLSEKVDSA